MADYYFDNTLGDDGGVGTSSSDPWQTETKFNATAFSAGDNIYFKCGETWISAIFLHDSGSSGSNITLSSYGTGNAPIFLSIITGLATGRADYWVLSNIEVTTGSVSAGIDIVGYANNLTIKDSVVHGCTARGIQVQNLAAGDVDNLLIENVTVYDNGTEGIHISDFTDVNNITGVVIQQVTSYGNGTNGPSNLDGIKVGSVTGAIVQHCTSHDNDGDGIDVSGNALNSIVRYNLVYNNTGSGLVAANAADGVTFFGNVSHHNDNGIHIKDPSTNCSAYNNTFAYNDVYGASLSTDNSVTFKNNIVAYNTAINMFTRASIQTLVSDYNLFWHPIGPATEFYDNNNTTYYSYSAWQGIGYDTNSFNEDPLLDADYHPTVNSSAYHAGTFVGHIRDYNARPYHIPPTIGAYEFNSGAPAQPRTVASYLPVHVVPAFISSPSLITISPAGGTILGDGMISMERFGQVYYSGLRQNRNRYL